MRNTEEPTDTENCVEPTSFSKWETKIIDFLYSLTPFMRYLMCCRNICIEQPPADSCNGFFRRTTASRLLQRIFSHDAKISKCVSTDSRCVQLVRPGFLFPHVF